MLVSNEVDMIADCFETRITMHSIVWHSRLERALGRFAGVQNLYLGQNPVHPTFRGV